MFLFYKYLNVCHTLMCYAKFFIYNIYKAVKFLLPTVIIATDFQFMSATTLANPLAILVTDGLSRIVFSSRKGWK